MILIISLFPQGVSIEDLKYLASKNKIPQNWENIMLELTSNDIVDPNKSQILNDSSENLEKSSSILKDQSMPNNHPDHHFKVGQYLYMSISINELQMIQFKIQKSIPQWLYSVKIYQKDLLQKQVLILEYLSYFVKKMLNCIKSEKYQNLKMIDYSSIVDFGLFKVSFSEDSLSDKDPESNSPTTISSIQTLNRCYSENFQEHVFKKYQKNLENLFKLHEQNLAANLKKDDLKNLIQFVNQSNGNEKIVLKEVLKDLCVDIPSIHKLFGHKDESLEQCEKVLSILDEFLKQPNNISFMLVKFKIILIITNISFYQFDFQTINPDEYSILIKPFKRLNEAIESFQKDVEFKKQKNIIKIMKAEKIFMIGYAIKILMEYRIFKFDLNCDISCIKQLVNLIEPKEREYSNIKELSNYLINQLDNFASHLQEIDDNSIVITSNRKKTIHSNVPENYLKERSQICLEVLVYKLNFTSASIKGLLNWKNHNEDYIEIFQDCIKTFSKYQLNELKEQCLKQFAKIFLKNKMVELQQKGENIQNESITENEIVKLVKNGQEKNQNKTILEEFEHVYKEIQKQDSNHNKNSNQPNVE